MEDNVVFQRRPLRSMRGTSWEQSCHQTSTQRIRLMVTLASRSFLVIVTLLSTGEIVAVFHLLKTRLVLIINANFNIIILKYHAVLLKLIQSCDFNSTRGSSTPNEGNRE